MELETLVYEKSDRIATMTLNRPDRGNALCRQMRDDMDLVMDDLDRDDDTRVLVVKSNGKNFCTGYDLTEWGYLWGSGEPSRPEDSRPHRRAPIFSRREFHESRERWMRLWRIRQATVGVVRGACVAGGLDLAGVLDIVFTADDAQFGQPEARTMGEIHTFGLWPVHLGMRKTKEWLFTGDSMTGTEAAELGLANRAVPAEEVLDVAMAYAERIAHVPLEMLYSHKEATNRWWDAMGIASAIAAANDADAMAIAGPAMADFKRFQDAHGVRAAVEDRDEPFSHHRTYWEAYQASRGRQGGREDEQHDDHLRTRADQGVAAQNGKG
ncbi:enoyl-CoA hydratase-related protein [Nocardioides kribbensis]|uniref:enoyl-CoA hydratase-related protein n=1 Tax=Nocardioides kribbensis TaxID=305517 RepID=UPI001D0CF892|nr:enoyl-CoA hydratase-related protein [Nocardioides kribbensis]